MASEIGSYWNAVQHYLRTGDASRLARFEGQFINLRRFLTDPDRIDELALLGEPDIPDIYDDGGR